MDYTALGAMIVAVISSIFAVVQWVVDRHDRRLGISRDEFQALRVNWTATTNLAAPVLTLRTLNDAPAMVVRELALMRSDDMTSAFTVAPFADWYAPYL